MAWRIERTTRGLKINRLFWASEESLNQLRSSLVSSASNFVPHQTPHTPAHREEEEAVEHNWADGVASHQFGSDSRSQSRSASSKKLARFFHSSTFSKSPPTSSSAFGRIEDAAHEAAAVAEDADILRTQDGRVLYSRTTSPDLMRTLFNLHLVAYEPVVNASIAILKSPLINPFFLRSPIMWTVKHTAYQHFCAGENVAEATKTLQKMWEQGLQGILDYSLEDATDNTSCDDNLIEFLNTINTTRELPQGSVSSACVKITAIAPLKLLERVSNLLRWQHKAGSGFSLPWKEDSLPLLSRESPTYHVQAEPPPLTAQEETYLLLAHERLDRLCKACEEVDLPLLVDAEYSSVQPAIDYLTYAVAVTYNRQGSRPLVFATIQAYLKDALPRLSLALDASSKRGIAFGVKLVRGAYITRENQLAASLQAASPIHSSIQETHNCYDACAAIMLEHLSAGKGAVLLATHNFQSGRVAASKAQELGLVKGDSRLQFAQLKGMADGLSLALAHAGFQVSKYLPFGPVQQVIPYLIRRAEENRGLLGNTVEDRKRIRKELRRRLFSAMGL